MIVSEFAPAKVNLFLAVHGPRPDGFHDLTSLVAQCRFGDTLRVELRVDGVAEDTLVCSSGELETGKGNLVRRAAEVFRRWSGEERFFHFELEKRIPIGAGLGGGSSDAVAALRAMRRLVSSQVREGEMLEMARELGSDCPLFLDGKPKLMRGRGDLIEAIPEKKERELSGRPILVLQPSFPVGTGWAYGVLRENPDHYADRRSTEALWQGYLRNDISLEDLLSNSFEGPVSQKYLGLRAMLQELRGRFGLTSLMSGSGSACFCLLGGEYGKVNAVRDSFEKWFGGYGIFIESSLS
ncbi:MAG: 4-(cytidine 5'-diphospho)-2-C-methyl-D-erythritol kinase [Puniceicoccaceae bacterium]